MTDKQSNWLDMFGAVNETYLENQTIYDAMPARLQAFTTFLAKVAAINSAASAQSSNITGVTQDKEVLRKNLCALSFINMTVIKSYAISINNNTLKTEMNYSEADLLAIKDDSIANFCQLRLNLASNNITPLADFGITPTTITTWQDAIDDYTEAFANPRNAAINRSNKTSLMKTLFSETTAFLKNQLDPLVQPLRVTNYDVYDKYFKSRIVIDLAGPGKGNVKISGTITDSQSGDPIVGAIFNVGPHTFKSKADGKFSRKILVTQTTTFNVTIIAAGYETITTTFQVSPNVDIEQDLQMNPVSVSVGSISGVVRDSGSLMGIGGATINISNNNSAINVNTDVNGNYAASGIEVGMYTATANASGYMGQSVSVLINANSNTVQDFSLAVMP